MSEDHWGYVILAYAVTGATVAYMVARILLEHRRLAAELARLERNDGDKGHEAK
jgi:heme exporter protein CcmD